MPANLIRGSTQILDASIPATKFVASLNLPTAQLQDGALFIKRDGTVAFTADQSFGGFKLTNVALPVSGTDGVNKNYVDGVVNGYDPKPSVKGVATTNVATLSGATTIDGVTFAAADRIGLVAQTTASQNGIWVISAGAWTRPIDWAGSTAVTDGSFFLVEFGTANKGTGWIVATQGAIVVDTTAITMQQVQGANSSVVAGNGITVAGNVVSTRNGNGISYDGSNAITITLNAASLNLSVSGLKISDSSTPGQVMIGGAANAATFTTFSGDVSSVSSAGAVTLATAIRRSSSFVFSEIPTGTVNGVNATFTLAATPVTGSPTVYVNGVRQLVGAGNNYTISAGTLTFITIPQTGDQVLADYMV